MASRFPPGASVYTKDGRRYVVDEVADGLVYCTAPGGAETEFPEAQLASEAEWASRADGRRDALYNRLKQSRVYAPAKGLDQAAAERTLTKVGQLFPGILDFVAFTVAAQTLTDNGDKNFIPELSIVKCRALFDAATAETRVTLLAAQVGAPPATLIGAVGLGENMARAMIDKGLDAAAFEAFGSRRRQ